MTEGSPAKLLIGFAVPLMLGNVFQQCYTFADTMIVGKVLGIHALAALGATEWLIFLVTGAIQGLTHGFSVIISQFYGNREEAGVKRSVFCAMLLSLFFAVPVSLLAQALVLPALHIIKIPEDLRNMAAAYLRILYLSIPVMFAYHMMAAVLRALGDSRTPLRAITLACLMNIGLDLCFVVLLGWGIQGAAAATVIAQCLSVLYCYNRLKKIELLKDIGIPKEMKKEFQVGEETQSILLKELKTGIPLGLQNMITAMGGLVVQSVINSFGVLFIAGYTAATKLYGLLEIPASSYGYTMSTYTGQNMGAGQYDRVKKGLGVCVLISVGTALIMSGIMVAAGDGIVSCFLPLNTKNTGETLKIAHDYLRILATFYPLLYILYTMRGCIQGMGKAALSMSSSIVQLVMRIGSALFLTRLLGEYGVFWGEILAWAGADLLLLFGCLHGFRRKKYGLIQNPERK